MFQFATVPLSIPQIWRAGIKLYKATFNKIWYLLLIFLGIAASGTIILRVLKFSPQQQAPMSLMWYASIAVITLLTLVGLYMHLLLIARIYNLINAADEPLKIACKLAWKKYGRYILYLICVVLLIFAIVIAFGIVAAIIFLPFFLLKLFVPAFAAWLISAKQLAIIATIILAALIAMPFICMYAITFLVFIFGAPLILFEDQSAWSAIKMGFKLIWGKYWRVITGIYVPLQIILIIPLTLYGITILFPQQAMLHAIYDAVWIVMNSFLYAPIYAALILVQYRDLKLRQDMRPVWVKKS